MANVSIRKTGDLPPCVKSAVEQLLGKSIGADEEVSVAAVPPQQVPPSGNRLAVAQRLQELLDRRAEKVRDVVDEDIDAAVDEGVDSAPRRRG
jgi:hypothetical protein